MKIGDIIKIQLRIRRLSIPDLEKKTGLSNADLKNIIYNKSRNMEKVKIIANALKIPISQFLPTSLQGTFSYEIYELAVKCICHSFKVSDIIANKETFDNYVVQMHNYIKANIDKTEKEFLTYAEGMIKSSIILGVLEIRETVDH